MNYFFAILCTVFLSTVCWNQDAMNPSDKWQTGADLSTAFIHSKHESLEDLGQQIAVFESYQFNKRHSLGIGLNVWAKFSKERYHDRRVNYFTYSLQLNYCTRLGNRWDFSVKPFFPVLSYHPFRMSNPSSAFWTSKENSSSEASVRERIYGVIPFNFEYHKKEHAPFRWNVGLSVMGYKTTSFYSALSTYPQVSEFNWFASLVLGIGYRF